MADYIDLIRTEEGDKPVNFNALVNKPIERIESLDKSNMKDLRSIDSGFYVLYGYFKPFPGSPLTITIDNAVTIVAKRTGGSHLLVIYALNCKQTFFEVLVDTSNSYGFTYSKTDVRLDDLKYLGDLDSLKTTEKGSLVGAINELYDMISATTTE